MWLWNTRTTIWSYSCLHLAVSITDEGHPKSEQFFTSRSVRRRSRCSVEMMDLLAECGTILCGSRDEGLFKLTFGIMKIDSVDILHVLATLCREISTAVQAGSSIRPHFSNRHYTCGMYQNLASKELRSICARSTNTEFTDTHHRNCIHLLNEYLYIQMHIP